MCGWWRGGVDPLATKVIVAQLCLTLCNPLDCSLPVSPVHGILQARILDGVHSHSFLQGIFPTQGSNPGLLHCIWVSDSLLSEPPGNLRDLHNIKM